MRLYNVEILGTSIDDAVIVYAEDINGTPLTPEQLADIPADLVYEYYVSGAI